MSKLSRAERKRARLTQELNQTNQTLAQIPSIERQAGIDESRQPRFKQQMSIWSSVMRWVVLAIEQEPDPNMGVRARDGWMRRFVNSEPLLAGVLNSVVDIDKNRGWVIEGAEDQVRRYTDVLHAADDGQGWRNFISWQAQSYYTARIGFVTELGRDGENGPLRALWSVDPAACQLTGIPQKPLRYYGMNGGQQEWLPDYFLRACSLVSTNETQIGYGFPAAERCLSLAKIMVGVLSHFKQQVLTEVPEGVLTGKNISQTQWETALEHYGEALQGYTDKFARLMSLMSEGDAAPELAITWFRHLPEGFDLESWISILIYGYALAFGYDPREFWPVSMGQLGTAKESDVQHRKATSKGDLDFSLAFQEKLQGVFPESLSFEFQSRDIEGEIAETTAKQAKAQFIETLAGLTANGQNLLSREQILSLAAEEDIIPDEFTLTAEVHKGTDTDVEQKEDLLHSELPPVPKEVLQAAEAKPQLQVAARRFPNERLVRCYYEPATRKSRLRVLFNPGMLARHSFPVAKVRAIDHVMVALKVDESTSQALLDAVKQADENIPLESLDNLHITLAMPHPSENVTQETMQALLNLFARGHQPLHGKIGGIAKFNPSQDDTIPLVALLDCADLPQFRQDVVNIFKYAGIALDETHGFIPHITLAYLPKDYADVHVDISDLPIAFESVYLAWQEDWQAVPLGNVERVERADLESVSRKFLADLRSAVVVGFISDTSILADVRRLVREAVSNAYIAGLNAGGVEDMDNEDANNIIALVTEQTDHVTNFVQDIRKARDDKESQRDILDNRVKLWQRSIDAAGQAGLASAKGNEMVTFRLIPGHKASDESCETCKRLLGQSMRRKTVMRKGLLVKPGNENYKCGCWACPHEWSPK